MAIITFQFESGTEIRTDAAPGERILDAAKRSGVSIDAPCNGNGTCGKCRIKLLEGEAEAERTRFISDEAYEKGWRLACETAVNGDVTVRVPDAASAYKTGIRTADLNDPAVKKAFDNVLTNLKAQNVIAGGAVYARVIAMAEPALDDIMPDNERLARAVEAEIGKKAVLSFPALKKLAYVLRENGFTVKVILADGGDRAEILDVLAPAEENRPLGLAIDIGTTTVTGALADMETGELLARASAGNGQIPYGADVFNRIIESTRPGGSERLRKAIAEDTLAMLIDRLCKEAGILRDRIYRVAIAGNTTMNHLLLGLYSDPVRMEPYIPSFLFSEPLRAADVIPGLNPAAKLLPAPNVGSYVGGDITAGVLASMLWSKEETTLFIDLGTNGELVIGNSGYMMCCACSAGPAFEGGDISCGMRATDGAIEKVTIDPETMEPALSIIGSEGQKPVGVCGSGIIDTIAELFRAGIISAKGKPVRTGDRVRFDEHGMGRYVLAFEAETADGREISLNEVDIDNFIRAKGAIFSAILLLLDQLGMAPSDVDRILIAGGIGSAIDFDNAVTIGMLPDVERRRFAYIGNSSLSGAYAMMLSDQAAEKTEELARNMTYVELSNEPGYMDGFVAACFLPHTDAALFPNA